MINKVFQFNTLEDALKAERDIEKVLKMWMLNHPYYSCKLTRIDKNMGFELIIDCNDITHSDSRLN